MSRQCRYFRIGRISSSGSRRGKGKSLALNGHLDTVPPGSGMTQPYAPVIKDGRLYGRGACDMKGAVAAMLYALLLLKRHNVELAGDLIFTGVIGEETRNGTRHLVVKEGFHRILLWSASPPT